MPIYSMKHAGEVYIYNLLLLCLSVGTRSDNGKTVVRCAYVRDVLVGKVD